jgi:glutamate racemase
MIGIFDSGSGGLTVLKAIREVLPSADVLYFGDIKNTPYGERPQEELSKLTVGAIKLLQERGANKIVSACNSTSASLAMSLFDVFDIEPAHIIEMVGPTVAYFKDSPARVLLCATEATIRSGIYQNAFGMIGKDIATVAIPHLAAAIEFGKPEGEIQKIIAEAFAGVSGDSFDVLVLGCTHYPLVKSLFEELYPNQAVFDPALAVAARVKKQFWPQEVGDGNTAFLLSQDSPQFRALVERQFPDGNYSLQVIQ